MQAPAEASPSSSLRDLVRPVSTLVIVSMLACFLLALRIALAGQFRQLFLVWNLFLAWMPLCFALMAVGLAQSRPQHRWPFLAAASAWLLFFPNAPYILTDLVHLGSRTHGRYWTDLVIILVFALTGLLLGFLSLFLMQRLLARRHGWVVGWCFAGAATLLGGFGIYVGRFLRWNSWDVLFAPHELVREGWQWLVTVPSEPRGHRAAGVVRHLAAGELREPLQFDASAAHNRRSSRFLNLLTFGQQQSSRSGCGEPVPAERAGPGTRKLPSPFRFNNLVVIPGGIGQKIPGY